VEGKGKEEGKGRREEGRKEEGKGRREGRRPVF